MANTGKIDVTCAYCGAPLHRFPSTLHAQSFCSPVCLGHYKTQTLSVQRFWGTVDTRGACWMWTGKKFPNGYGCFFLTEAGTRKWKLAHRVAWELTHGCIPDGLFICHTCDTPPCCNPAHLFLGTCAENVADMQRKGRRIWARGSATPNAKLTEADIVLICALRASMTPQEMAPLFHVAAGTIRAIQTGAAWKHVERPIITPRASARVTPEQVKAIRLLEGLKDRWEVAAEFHLTVRHVSDIWKKVCWKDL